MTDVYEHNPGDHEDPQPGSTWIVGIVGTVVLIVTVLGLTALLYRANDDETRVKVIEKPYEQVAALRAAQEARLHMEPNWIERESVPGAGDKVKVYVIPIEGAMEVVMNEANSARQEPRE